MWQTDDQVAQMKLLYLAMLVQDYEDAPGFQSLFGQLDISLAAFDCRWTLEEMIEEEHVDSIERALKPPYIERIQPTGRALVDEWRSALLRRRDESVSTAK